MTRIIAALVLALALTGCGAGFVDLDDAGRTTVTLESHNPADLKDAGVPAEVYNCGVPLKKATYTSGKEIGSLTIERKSDCTTKVEAKEVKAFDGIEFAARAAEIQTKEQGQTLSDVLDADGIGALTDLARAFASGGF